MSFWRQATYKLLSVYYRLAKPKTFGVRVMVFSGDDLLLVRHTYGNSRPWMLPGGGFKPQRESPEAAAQREIREELALALDNPIVFGSYESTAQHKRDTVYCLAGQTASRNIRKSGEIEDIQWCKPDALPDDINTVTRKALAFWRAKQEQA